MKFTHILAVALVALGLAACTKPKQTKPSEPPPAAAETPQGDRTTSSMRLNHYTVGDPVPEDERGQGGDQGHADFQHVLRLKAQMLFGQAPSGDNRGQGGAEREHKHQR